MIGHDYEAGASVNRTIWIGVIGGILLLLALLLNWLSNQESSPDATDSAPQTQEESSAPPPPASLPTEGDEASGSPPDGTSGQTDSNPDAANNPESSTDQAKQPTESDTVSDGQSASVDAVPEASTGPILPTFDVVRIDPNGDAVIAGRAEPGSSVTVLDGDTNLGTVTADDRGEWVYLPNSPLPPGPHELKLKSEMPDKNATFGKGTVVLVVPKPGHDVAGRETPVDEPQEPLVVLIPDESPGAELIQAPRADGSNAPAPAPGTATAEPSGVKSADGALSVETIDYDPSGNISIAGKGPKSALVIAYLDNNPIGSGPVEENGTWRVNPDKEVTPGVYTLRLDAIRNSGVVARLEIPFSRAAPLTDLSGDAFIVVQPGNSLWRIARRTLGDGYSFTVIYEANSDQIRNPDLIYPGQVFEIPKQ